jgi:hypothetical protein
MTGLIGALAVALVAWFAAGTIWNVRLGRETMRWMQDGLPRLGARTTVRWLGSSVVELKIAEAQHPFAAATVLIFLEPRDLPWWPLSRLRGRRDTLIVRGTLRTAPAVEFEALDPASWSGREALGRVPREWPGRKDLLHVRGEGGAAIERAEALLAHTRGLEVKRLSVRRAEPHFQLHVALPDRGRPAREFFEAVHALAGCASDAGAPGAAAWRR